MRDFFDQVEAAVNHAHFYYLALFACLAIPDICGAMESSDGEAKAAKYIAWFDRYVAAKYVVGPSHEPSLTAEDCYYFRCSMLHQGRTQHPKSSFSRILFVEPGASPGITLHNNVLNDALNIDVTIFCRDILQGARQWLKAVEGTPNYQQNFSRFMQRHPNGLAPYIAGLPVIA